MKMKLVRVILDKHEFTAALACYGFAKVGFKGKTYFEPGSVSALLTFETINGEPHVKQARVEMQVPEDQE